MIESLKNLLYKMADDCLIIGHRHSEWTGLGPLLEEDIAFSSIAQDKVGHAFQLYTTLQEQLGEDTADTIAFLRNEKEFKCCQLVEFPNGEYDFSLVRQFFFDHSELLRYDALKASTFEPLAKLAAKFYGEVKYHVFHADTWLKKLADGNEESRARIQSAINEVYPIALGIFEPGHVEVLLEGGIFIGEAALKAQWKEKVAERLEAFGFSLPEVLDESAFFGGRNGYHTEHLQPLIEEMGTVIRMDSETEW